MKFALQSFQCLVVVHWAAAWELKAHGRWLVNSSNNAKIHLKCVNWYGQHLDSQVANGLEMSSIENISDVIASLGSNCVRLPLSQNSIVDNTVIDPKFLWNFDDNTRYLDVVDAQVAAFSARGIMTVLNIHNLNSGWVGRIGFTESNRQGFWNNDNVSTQRWASTLALLAQRYRGNDFVIGIDIYNEIHDEGQRIITWGVSLDKDNDWKEAASMAYAAMYDANPKLLVIVSGLCRGYDLRDMVKSPGPELARQQHKLVYTTHFYPWSGWWTNELFNWNNVFLVSLVALCLAFGAVAIMADALHRDSQKPNLHEHNSRDCMYLWAKTDFSSFLSAMFPFLLFWIGICYIWMYNSSLIGCSTLTAEVSPWFYFLVSFTGVCVILILLWRHTFLCNVCGFWFAVLMVFQMLFILHLSVHQASYEMTTKDLERWKISELGALNIPLFVGEFGKGVYNDPNTVMWRRWAQMLRFLHENDLDWAYWTLNGRRWNGTHFVHEGLGLLDPSMNHAVNMSFVEQLFRV